MRETEEGDEDEATIDKLIAIEWDLLNDLKKTLNTQALKPLEKVRLANAVAYHAIVLNKLLAQKGQELQFNEETLGDFIGKQYADGKMSRLVRMEFRDWKSRLSLKR